MTATLLVIAAAVLAGLPVSLLLERKGAAAARAGEGFLFGAGVVWATVLLLSLSGMGWSRARFGIAAGAVTIVLWICAAARLRGGVARPRPQLADVVTLAIVGGYALFATAAAPWEFDYLIDFGLKGRAFWEHGGIDWPFLRSVFSRSFHADYPLLLPSLYDAVAMVSNGWNDRFLGLMNVAFGVAAIGIVRAELAEDCGGERVASIATAALAPLLLSPWIGIADGPVGAYMIAAVLRLRRSVRDGTSSTPGAILLGLAACTKNEGVAMIVAVAAALLVAASWRAAVRLWPAVAIALPWMILARLHGLGNDLDEGNALQRAIAHLRDPETILRPLAHAAVGKPLLWAGIILGVVLCTRELLARERFVLVAFVVQLAFCLGAYLVTPYDTQWHVRWSWERLVSQVTPLIAYVVVAALFWMVYDPGNERALRRQHPRGDQ